MRSARAEKLRKVIEHHLPYEIRMLFETYERANAVPFGLTRTAIVESFCIHARVLHEFLTKRRGTAHAKNVTNGYTPFKNGEIDRSIIRMLSDHVAHLTLERSTDTGKLVRTEIRSMLVIALADELIVLRRHLQDDYRKTWEITVQPGGGYRLDWLGRISEVHPTR